MTENEDDLRAIFRTVAEGAEQRPGAENKLLVAARRRRVMTKALATLTMLALVGGIAGASMMLTGRGAITPVPAADDARDCVSVGYDLAVFVPDGATQAEVLELGEALEEHDAVMSAEFVKAEQAEREFRARNPDHEGALSTTERVDHYRVDLKAGLDARNGGSIVGELANMGSGAVAPALDCPQEQPATTLARYFFEIAQGNTSASGVLEVNWEEKMVCLNAKLSSDIMASHLLLRDPRSSPEDAERVATPPRIVLTFFDPDTDTAEPDAPDSSTQCLQGEELGELQPELHLLLDQPQRFKIDFHRGPNDDPGLIAELRQLPDIENERGDRYVDDAHGVRVEVPRGWQVASQSLTPNLGDPREILSMGTAPMPPGGSCAQQPVRALDALGPTDALISIQERRGSAAHPLRPQSFRDELEDRFSNIELCTDASDFKPYWFAFSDAGRDFHLLAALGTEASAARTRQFWAVLDSLEFFGSEARGAVRATVTGFMQARVDGTGAEAFLGSERWPGPGPTGEPAPLYPDPPVEDFRVEFVGDDLGQGSYEVGVSLIFEDGSSEETLFVRRTDDGFVIVGARGGLEGP